MAVIAIPISLQSMITIGVNMTDTVMVEKLGEPRFLLRLWLISLWIYTRSAVWESPWEPACWPQDSGECRILLLLYVYIRQAGSSQDGSRRRRSGNTDCQSIWILADMWIFFVCRSQDRLSREYVTPAALWPVTHWAMVNGKRHSSRPGHSWFLAW